MKKLDQKSPIHKSPAFYVRRRQYALYPLIAMGFFTILFAALGGGSGLKADGKMLAGVTINKEKSSTSGYLTTLPESKVAPIMTSKSEALSEEKKKSDAAALASMSDNFDFGALDKAQKKAHEDAEKTKANPKKTGKDSSLENLIARNDQKEAIAPQKGFLIAGNKNGYRRERKSELTIPVFNRNEGTNITENKKQNPPEEIKVDKTVSRSGFYSGLSVTGSENNPSSAQPKTLSIKAVVHGNQAVSEGSVVKLRLTESLALAGQVLPSNTFVFAQVSFGTNRVLLHVNSVRVGGRLLPLDLKAYDLDGTLGIAAPELNNNGLGKEALSEVPSTVSTGIGVIDRPVNALVGRKTKKEIDLPSEYNLILRHGDQ